MPALDLRNIYKSFGSVRALQGADFSLRDGELHALLGENGAGKSTLMHLAGGMLQPDRGEILVGGKVTGIPSPRVAANLGIAMVHQHFTSVPAFTVAENVALAAGWRPQPGVLRQRVHALSGRLGIPLDPDGRAETLDVAMLQRLEVLKALATASGILLFDEPTGSLAPAESEEFLVLIRRMVRQGAAAVLITHKLDEALRHADRVTVLRRGRVVLTGPSASFAPEQVRRAMLGGDFQPDAARRLTTPGEVAIRADDVTVLPLDGHGPNLRHASFNVRAGEVVGIAAVEGSGQRELLRLVAGLVPLSGGELLVAQPAAFVPEDRTLEGIIPEFTVTENLTLGLGRAAPWVHRGVIDTKLAFAATAELIARHGIDAQGPDARAGTLSGGNQQKLILARALEGHPRVLVLENPGRGLDLRAVREVYERLRAAASRGSAVLLHSSDLDELLEWSDRVLVVVSGVVIAMPAGSTRREIGERMLSEVPPG